MNIALLTDKSPWGGAQVHSYHLARALARRHDVSVVQFGHTQYSDASVSDGIEGSVRTIDLGHTLGSMPTFALLRTLHGLKIDVAVFPKGWLFSGSVKADAAIRLCARRFVTIEHQLPDLMPARTSRECLGGRLLLPSPWWYREYVRRCARSAFPHRIVCVSESVRERLVAEYRFPRARTLTILNGVDSRVFGRNERTRAATRQQLGLEPTCFLFGAVGRFHTQKGYDLLLRAFAGVCRSEGTEVRLLLAGEGPERECLMRLARELRIEERVIFHPFTNNPAEIYSSLDVFLLPSRFEGLPLTLLEAMACECPIIAARVGGIPEIARFGVAGWIVEPENVQELRRTMLQAVQTDRAVLRQLAACGRDIVTRNFDLNTQMSGIVNVVESLTIDVHAAMEPLDCSLEQAHEEETQPIPRLRRLSK